MNYIVSSGETSTDVILEYDSMTVLDGGIATNTTVNVYGTLNILDDGVAINTTVNDGGFIIISSGGTANSATVKSGGVYVSSGGVANDTMVNSGASIYIASGAAANRTIISSGGYIYVSSGGVANDTMVNSGGSIYIASGAAINTHVDSKGRIFILKGGTAERTTVVSGDVSIYSSGTAINTHIAYGDLIVSKGGLASGTVMSGGRIFLLSGGTANNTTLLYDGDFYNSGLAKSTTVMSGGTLFVYACGAAESIAVSSGGRAIVNGKLSGLVTVEKGADLIMDQYAVFDFDLTQTAAGADALVNGFSKIIGNPSFTLTVEMDQPTGIYQLARDVYDFDKTISIMNTAGTMFGTLSIGQTIDINNLSYFLSLNDSTLFLSIREPGPDTMAPAVFSVTQSHSSPTLRPVTVTAEFADDVELKSSLYRIGESGAWTDYAGGVTVTENTPVYFKAVDTSGNESEIVSHSVTNIEKDVHEPVYVYLDFDGEETSYTNQYLNLSFPVTITASGFSAAQKQTILTELVKTYSSDGVVFTLDRPKHSDYSTLYFGISDDFACYGNYFGISETIDECNRIGNDNAFVLLDSSYSINQIISVAETALNHIMGFTYSRKDKMELRDYAINTYLLSTEWSQSEPYNKYCPVDSVSGKHCPTGCGPTAIAQIAYYWIENGMLDLSLVLDNSDYASLHVEKKIINANPENSEKYGYLSFGETNDLLSYFKLGDTDSIAALVFAIGIERGATYNGSGTRTYFSPYAYSRLGLCIPYSSSLFEVVSKQSGNVELNENSREILIRELLAGHPVEASLSSINPGDFDHTIVIDGYDSATDKFHVNFGWGPNDRYNTWFSLENLKAIDGYALEIDLHLEIMPEIFPVLSMSVLSFEKETVERGNDFILHFCLTNSGKVKSSESMAHVFCGEKLVLSQALDYLYPGEKRDFSCTIDSSELSLGTNTIIIKVEVPDDCVLSASRAIQVCDHVGMSFFTGDFNGDGYDTLAVETYDEASPTLTAAVTIYQNGEPWGLGITMDPGWEVVGTGDFSGDGLDDFLRVNEEGYVVGEMSNGNGTFSPQVLNYLNDGWNILGTGDFNGNGTDDVLIANPTGASDTVGLLGYWESGVTWTLINGYSPEWTMVSTGDFNGDGKCDMLWKNSFEGDGGLTYNAYCTWIMDDPIDWRMVSVANPDEWNFLCSGDFDGDGSHDIAMINDVGVVGIWGVNDGYLSSWSILSAVTSEWMLAGVGDFNADGTDDIAWCNSDTGLTGYWQINNKELTSWANIVTLG